MLKAHHDAVRARAEAHPTLATKIEDLRRLTLSGKAVQGNYVVLTTNLPTYAGDRLAAPQAVDGDYALEVRARVVAVDSDGLFMLMDAVRDQFVGHRLTVAGRAVSPLTGEYDDIRIDQAAGLIYQDAFFDATTSRAI
jgi:hypothetical protein